MAVTISGTTGLAVPLGSASAPSESNTTSATTGAYYPSGTTYGLSTNGTNAVYIDASQNVGIGTSSPSVRLHVAGATQNTGLAIFTGGGNLTRGLKISTFAAVNNDAGVLLDAQTTTNGAFALATAGTERMRIDSSGNVGIGTDSPGALLHVGTATAKIRIGATAGSEYLDISRNSATGNIIYNAAQTTYGTHNFQIAGTEAMRIDNSGNLLVGQTSYNSGKITVLTTGNGSMSCAQTGTSGDMIYFRTSTNTLAGYIQCPTGTTTSYLSLSDYRLKENVTPIATGLEKILALKPVTYDWISDKLQGEGFIAHELQEVIPLAVAGEKDAVNEDGSIRPQGVDPAKIVVHLVAALQELSAEVEALKAKVGA